MGEFHCLSFSRTNNKDFSGTEKKYELDFSRENMLVSETWDVGKCHLYKKRKMHRGITQVQIECSGREKNSGSGQTSGKGLVSRD